MSLQNKKVKSLLGYCHNKSFGPYSLPVKFQNIICANYANKLKLIYGPGLGEPIFSKNHLQLKSMIKTKDTSSGIVMLSFYMMPKSKMKRLELFNLAFKFKKEIHFVIENMFFKNRNDIKKIEQIFLLNKFTKNSDLIFNSLKK
tara:strand:- start:140 stop:571 length:432 start_codon:yes stop_codon:yes gene_type:complete